MDAWTDRGGQDRVSRLAEALWKRRHPDWVPLRPGHEVQPHLRLPARHLGRYARDRLRLRAARLLGPPRPWITADALTLLDQVLRPTDRVLEWGAGGTTRWLADRVAHVLSVEGVSPWYDVLAADLRERGVTNVDLRLVPAEGLGYGSDAHRAAYAGVEPGLAPGSLDVVLVDGEYRDDCTLRALDLLRPGGVLVLDNAEAYLPSATRSPWHVTRPVSPTWSVVAARLDGWRGAWTTNGVWDTALWFKP